MDRAPEFREAYIAEACGNDEDPRREVESLLMLDASPVIVDRPPFSWPQNYRTVIRFWQAGRSWDQWLCISGMVCGSH
jgi:hypothetical protein